ncbi:hypothetical protein [Actinoplanes sp. NPDC049316]|uniref:hypothetical protein n=1 Tax=Actinoplanes sp. NPDC049316 TaxID=3154727 RepID=UPI0034495CBF
MNNHCRRCGRAKPANRPARWFVCPRPAAVTVPDDPDGGALAYLRGQLLDAIREPNREHVEAILVRARRSVRRRRLRDATVIAVLVVAAALLGLGVGAGR